MYEKKIFFSRFVALFLTFLKNLYLGVTLINVCTFLVPKWCVVFFLKCLVKYLALGKNYALVLKMHAKRRRCLLKIIIHHTKKMTFKTKGRHSYAWNN